jgi:TetR/AcrR family transcriptional regulator, cholesterol catabolism regulator
MQAPPAPEDASQLPNAIATVAKRPRGRPRKTVDERDDGNRRQELIHAAAKLFHRKGFDATSTRDIAAAVGMRSGSPFYHFRSKGELLHAVMEEGMRSAIARQAQALQKVELTTADPRWILAVLIRNQFDVLLGPGSGFIPVMLYESRSLTPRQRASLVRLQSDYEAAWTPVLEALHAAKLLRTDVKLARLLIFGALNWSVQWYDRRKGASLDDLTAAALALFIHEA